MLMQNRGKARCRTPTQHFGAHVVSDRSPAWSAPCLRSAVSAWASTESVRHRVSVSQKDFPAVLTLMLLLPFLMAPVANFTLLQSLTVVID